jgi:hypothetical protein
LARVGITGHRNLTPKTTDLAYRAIRRALSAYQARELTGISCLADGADSIFAQAVLDLGGRLEVVLPATDYRDRTIAPSHVARFDELLGRAFRVRTMPYAESGLDAYEAANRHLVSSCERLFAVWDGGPAGGRGGTADVVRYANTRGVPVEIVWPVGAERG